MGYTHYWDDLKIQEYPDDLISVFNRAYQDFLGSWVTIEWKHINLFSLFFKREDEEELFNEHFHEWAQGASWGAILFGKEINAWNFCKTARKSYDVAVVLTLLLASIVLNKDYSSDGRVIHTFPEIQEYIKEELDDSFIYDIEKLKSLFDLWLNKCITFQEEIDQLESMKQYTHICDLPDSELEYIAEQIMKWVTSIYLNNNQIVDISFRN